MTTGIVYTFFILKLELCKQDTSVVRIGHVEQLHLLSSSWQCMQRAN